MKQSDETPAPNARALELIEQAAHGCADFVQRSLSVPLDFTSETLPILDHYCLAARQEIAAQPAALPLLTRAIGAYFGEVLRREHTGFWRAPSEDAHDWRICFNHALLAVSPVGMAYDLLCDTTEHDGPSSELQMSPDDRVIVARRLELLGEVDEQDFFRLSTRFDAIEVALAALGADVDTSDGVGPRYELEDYEELLFARQV